MTAKLRNQHRNIFICIFPCLLALYLSALYFRRPPPTVRNFPAALDSKEPPGRKLLLEKRIIRLEETTAAARVWKLRRQYWLSLHSAKHLKARPELLVYWQKGKNNENSKDSENNEKGKNGEDSGSNDLSPQARFIGAWRGEDEEWFLLPPVFSNEAGQFILYNLGHSEVVSAF